MKSSAGRATRRAEYHGIALAPCKRVGIVSSAGGERAQRRVALNSRAACRVIGALVAALAASAACAAETLAIVNARVETVAAAGTLPKGTVVIRDGRIVAVGADVRVPDGARVIDAAGRVVTPGFIAPSTNVTVNEVNLVGAARDDSSGNRLSAGFDVQLGVNPASTLVRVGLQSGVTMVAVTPLVGRFSIGTDADDDDDVSLLQGGGDGVQTDPALFAGEAAVVRLEDGNPDPVVRSKAAVALDLGEAGAAHAGGSRAASLLFVRAALEDARDFAGHRAEYARGETRDYGLSRLDLEALVPVAQGRTPLLIRVSRASDIRQALRLAREQHLRVILEGAEEGWRVAQDIAAAHVPVLIDPQDDLPYSFEMLGARLDNAARLQRAGVLIAIKAKRDFNSLRPIRLNAGTAVAYGLSYAEALAAITINPAKIWGVADRVGSLEPGKDADLVVWSGDPLETLSYPIAIFVRGTQQPGTSRRLELRDRYLKPDDGLPPAYH
jgi:imidazolonepropionase-like amidohydrolase